MASGITWHRTRPLFWILNGWKRWVKGTVGGGKGGWQRSGGEIERMRREPKNIGHLEAKVAKFKLIRQRFSPQNPNRTMN